MLHFVGFESIKMEIISRNFKIIIKIYAAYKKLLDEGFTCIHMCMYSTTSPFACLPFCRTLHATFNKAKHLRRLAHATDATSASPTVDKCSDTHCIYKYTVGGGHFKLITSFLCFLFSLSLFVFLLTLFLLLLCLLSCIDLNSLNALCVCIHFQLDFRNLN